MKNTLLFSILLLSSHFAFAWGGRGHHTICDAAVFLVKNEELSKYLRTKPHMMGHLCNIPDIYWRSIPGDDAFSGGTAHYINSNILGLEPKDVDLDFNALGKKYVGTDNQFKSGQKIQKFFSDFGSNWWRADQFFRRAVGYKDKYSRTSAPKDSKEQFDDAHPYNQVSFDFIVNLGLMGHFVADNAQPLHTTADYDGYKEGHGGVHGYYEDAVVSALPYNLQALVYEEGQKILKDLSGKKPKSDILFLKEDTVLKKMRSLGQISFSEIPVVLKADKVKSPSVIKEEKGMQLKTAAERDPPEKTAKAFQGLIVRQMARAAVLLAQLWDEAYVQVGKPNLNSAKSYKFPLQPDFVSLDYL